MKMQNVSLRGIKADPLAHELATSEGTKPYLDCLRRHTPRTLQDLKSHSKSYETYRSKSGIPGEYFQLSNGRSRTSRTNT
jgi:hypothetical protein